MNTRIAGSHGIIRLFVVILLLGAVAGCSESASGGNLLTHELFEPQSGATTAKLDINCGSGHLTIDRLTGGEPLLAGGTLEYYEKQEPPTRSLVALGGEATLTLKASGGSAAGSGFRWPWQACAGGAYEWHIHLNPNVQYDLTAHSDGGNVRLDLAGMAITRLAADTGGGNVDLALPESTGDLSVTAETGGGNVTVLVPAGVAAKIHATSGLGKVIVDSRFSKLDEETYQSGDYDGAADRVEITLKSGAGNVTVNTK